VLLPLGRPVKSLVVAALTSVIDLLDARLAGEIGIGVFVGLAAGAVRVAILGLLGEMVY
jgi:hypothetical protein